METDMDEGLNENGLTHPSSEHQLERLVSAQKLLEYYTYEDVVEKVGDVEELNEYMHGWTDAVMLLDKKQYVKKKYVDMFLSR